MCQVICVDLQQAPCMLDIYVDSFQITSKLLNWEHHPLKPSATTPILKRSCDPAIPRFCWSLKSKKASFRKLGWDSAEVENINHNMRSLGEMGGVVELQIVFPQKTRARKRFLHFQAKRCPSRPCAPFASARKKRDIIKSSCKWHGLKEDVLWGQRGATSG